MGILLNLVNEGTTTLNEYITFRLKKMGNGTPVFEKLFFFFTVHIKTNTVQQKGIKL